MIGEVLSRVDARWEFFRDVCYEWEEECAEYLGVPLRKIFVESKPPLAKTPLSNKLSHALHVIAKKTFQVFPPVKRVLWDPKHPAYNQDMNLPLSICFIMFVTEMPILTGSNCIPVFCDVWSDFMIEEVARRTRNFKLFYVTYLEVYKLMKSRYPWSSVHYMPQSVSDKYHSENFAAYRDKTIDVVQVGRRNPVLHEYMLRYVREHNGIEYVYGENGTGVSASGGRPWPIKTRSDYMNILAASKVSLTGCSGVDSSRPYTYGICAITPRFYEAAVSGCAIISRYPDNEEFTRLKARNYFPNVTSYEQFCYELERALAMTPEELYAQNRDFILNSLTSRRAEQIRNDLEALS